MKKEIKSNLIYIDDQYCMNPKCLCNEYGREYMVKVWELKYDEI